MRRPIGVALVALALVGMPLAAVAPAAARDDVSLSVNPGVVAYGYRDGYWDRDHHWHRWHSRADANWYRTHYKEHYYNRSHRGEEEQGWRSSDRWWDHR